HPPRLVCPAALPGRYRDRGRAERPASEEGSEAGPGQPAAATEAAAATAATAAATEGPAADEEPRRRGAGDQVRRAPHLRGAAPAGGKAAVPVGDAGRDLRIDRQGGPDATGRRAAPDRWPARDALHL